MILLWLEWSPMVGLVLGGGLLLVAVLGFIRLIIREDMRLQRLQRMAYLREMAEREERMGRWVEESRRRGRDGTGLN